MLDVKTPEVICFSCGNIVTVKDNYVELKNPRSVSEPDFEYGVKREGVLVCCGRIRMAEYSGEQFDYPLLDEEKDLLK